MCRKTANSTAAAHKLARSSCCSIFPVFPGASNGVHATAVAESDNEVECVFLPQRINLMHLRLETEGVINHVLGRVFPPPPPLPTSPPMQSAAPSRSGAGNGAGNPVGSPAPFFWMSGDSFEYTQPSPAPDVGGSDSGISFDDNDDPFVLVSPVLSTCAVSPAFSACSVAPFSLSVASDVFPSDLESDDGTVPSSPVASVAARQGPKRRRVGPVFANRSAFLLNRQTAAEHAVGQIKGGDSGPYAENPKARQIWPEAARRGSQWQR